MITSFEVGAIFDIENRASDTIATIAEQVQELATVAKEAADSLQALGDVSFGNLNRRVRSLRENLMGVQRAAADIGAGMEAGAAAVGAAASKAAEEIDGIGAAADRAKAKSEALRQELAIPYAMGGLGGGYSGGGGYGGGGLVPSYDPEVINPQRPQIGYNRPIIDAESYELSRLGYGALHLPAPDPEELGSFGGGGGLPALIPGSPYYSGDSGGANFRRSGYVPNWVPGGVGTPGGGSVPPAGGGGLGAQVLHWGAGFAAKRGWTGLGGWLGRIADEVNPRTGLVPAIYELGSDAIGAGLGAIEDTVFGPKPRQQAVQAEHEQHNDLAGRWLRGLFPLSLGIDDLFDHPPSAANTARSPAASAAAPAAVNSNNTTTISVGGVNVTVNAAPGQEGQAAGQSVVSSIVNAIRTHLMTSSGPGEGVTHAAGTVGLMQ